MSPAGITRSGRPIQEAIERANHENDGKHYLNAPSHASLLFRQFYGDCSSFERNMNDDPLLYAYQLRDALPRWLGYMQSLVHWSNEVIDATPDQIAESGAQ